MNACLSLQIAQCQGTQHVWIQVERFVNLVGYRNTLTYCEIGQSPRRQHRLIQVVFVTFKAVNYNQDTSLAVCGLYRCLFLFIYIRLKQLKEILHAQ